jgi:dTDP-4-dehydrorhamnose 3,5-epimerase
MTVTPLRLAEVVLVEPRVFADDRGTFFELWRQDRFAAVSSVPFVQDNVSVSRRGTVRGLHLQHPHPQGKLVSVLAGAAWDVAMDVRIGSPTFGQWAAAELSEENRHQLWIPPGFAHGFQALRDGTVFTYKCTDFYRPECERTVHWADPALGIPWPLPDALVSPRDAAAPRLAEMAPGTLPDFA